MNNTELAITLATIIYGLFLTDLFASLHRLLRNKNVKWHWLPILSAWFVFLVLIKNWWGIAEGNNQFSTIVSFIAYCHLFVLIYLLVSSVFPDKVPVEGVNLREYYFENSRYFWILMSLVSISSFIVSLFLAPDVNKSFELGNMIVLSVYWLMTISLAVWKNYYLHSIVLILFVLLVLNEILSKLN